MRDPKACNLLLYIVEFYRPTVDIPIFLKRFRSIKLSINNPFFGYMFSLGSSRILERIRKSPSLLHLLESKTENSIRKKGENVSDPQYNEPQKSLPCLTVQC
ncbi:hypothetical protein CEXT_477301 [Caerostris extrusa]|uniref:Maturase K n=1 Tax=Caerostris extrusa TaxID=172846 RepID=A0AAV4VEW1_CAEEX|nr:hypothetical protein CEXT_477301 [Caerostris extrusa]